MIQATRADKNLVVEILAQAFATNPSVQYIIPPHKWSTKSIRALMAYSFEWCLAFGQVWLSEDKTACALLLRPDRKKTSIRSVLQDLQLVWKCTGLLHLGKVLYREKQIKKQYPQSPFLYLWFIGVLPVRQKEGRGTAMLQQILEESSHTGLPLYLETSVPENVAWYQHMGFECYHEEDIGYRLYFLRRLL